MLVCHSLTPGPHSPVPHPPQPAQSTPLASYSPPGGQRWTGSLPPSPAWECTRKYFRNCKVCCPPQEPGRPGEGSPPRDGRPRNVPWLLGVGLGPATSRAGHWGLRLECAERQLPRESLHLIRLSLGLPDPNRLGLGSGGRAASSQGLQVLG